MAAAFAARRNARGEVTTRVNLYRLLFNAGKVDEAGAQVERTMQAARASGDPVLIGRSQVLKARHLWGTGKDLEAAYLLLRQAEPALFPNGSYSPRGSACSPWRTWTSSSGATGKAWRPPAASPSWRR